MKKYIKSFIVLLSIAFSLSSCLKETSHPPLYGWSTSSVVSFQDNGGPDGSGTGYASVPTSPYPLYNFSYAAPLANDTAGFDAIVIYGPNPAPEDITVNLEVDTAALTAFNNANGTSYVVPSDNAIYSFPSSVVIKKGESQAKAHVVITTTSSFDYSASYALPLTIASATGATVSSNFSTEINAFLIQNKFDGEYTVTGSFIENSGAYTDEGIYPVDAYLITAGANSVSFYDQGNSLAGKAINSAGTLSYFGGFDPIFTIDPTTGNVTSVTNAYGNDGTQTSSNSHGRWAELDPSGVNKYDLSTKTMEVTYDMYQIDYTGSQGNLRAVFTETFTYKGSR